MEIRNKNILGIILGLLFILNINISGIKPSKIYKITPDSLGLDFKSILIESSPEIELYTWIYSPNPETNKKTVLILSYPDAGNMSDYVYHSSYLVNAGYTVVTFDYRGFGKSTEYNIESDYLYYNEFSDDLISVVDKVYLDFKDFKIGIWALSMGTIVTTRAYDKIKDKIDFIIGESYVVDTDIFIGRIKTIKDKVIRLPKNDIKYSELIESIDIPILLFIGSEDIFTTSQDCFSLKKKLEDNCTVIEYQGNHLGGFLAWPEKGIGKGYIEQINTFLDKV